MSKLQHGATDGAVILARLDSTTTATIEEHEPIKCGKSIR